MHAERVLWRGLVPLLALLGSGSETAQATCPSRATWPTERWPSRSAEITASRAQAIREFEAYAFPAHVDGQPDRDIHTGAVVLIQDGAILYERYGDGFDARTRHNHAGFAKSLFSALAGVAVAEGALGLDDSVCDHLDGIRADNCVIRTRDLMACGSGLRWVESEEPLTGSLDALQHTSMIQMYLGDGRADAARFVLNHERRDPPGTTWQHSNGDTTALGAVVAASMAPRHGETWAFTSLLDRIGAGDSVLSRDRQGSPLLWHSGAHDLARLAFLFLNDGCWEDVRLLPEGWVSRARTVPDGFRQQRVEEILGIQVPGHLWFVNTAVPEHGLGKPWPNLPDDMYFNFLRMGGVVMIIPSRDLILIQWTRQTDTDYDAYVFVDKVLAIAGDS